MEDGLMYSHEHAVESAGFPDAKAADGKMIRGRTLRLIARVLASHADEAGRSWPSIKTIGKESQCGKSTVIRALPVLQSMGLFTMVSGGPKEKSNRYVLQAAVGPKGKEVFMKVLSLGTYPPEGDSSPGDIAPQGRGDSSPGDIGVVPQGRGDSSPGEKEVLPVTNHKKPTREANQPTRPPGREDEEEFPDEASQERHREKWATRPVPRSLLEEAKKGEPWGVSPRLDEDGTTLVVLDTGQGIMPFDIPAVRPKEVAVVSLNWRYGHKSEVLGPPRLLYTLPWRAFVRSGNYIWVPEGMDAAGLLDFEVENFASRVRTYDCPEGFLDEPLYCLEDFLGPSHPALKAVAKAVADKQADMAKENPCLYRADGHSYTKEEKREVWRLFLASPASGDLDDEDTGKREAL